MEKVKQKKNKQILLGLVLISSFIIVVLVVSLRPFAFYDEDVDGGTVYTEIPDAPELNPIPLTDTDGVITLSWSNPGYLYGFRIYRSTGINTPFTLLKSLDKLTTSYSFTETNGGYFYKVHAYNNIGESAYSNTVLTVVLIPLPLNPPEAPTLNLIFPSTDDDGDISLSWTKPTGTNSFRIYRSKNEGSFSLIITTTSTSYVDRGLLEGKYEYKIIAHNIDGDSPYSEIRSVIVAFPDPVDPDPVDPDPDPDPDPVDLIPNPPVLKTIDPQTSIDGSVKLEWDIVSDADRYAVYKSIDDISYDSPVVVNVNYYDDTETNGVYYYKLKAGNIEDDYSDYSNTKSVTVQIPDVPDAPITNDITYEITDSGIEISISWSSVICNSYNLYKEIVVGSNNTGFILIAEDLTSTSYSEILIDAGKYSYKVSAVNTQGESDLSNSAVVNITDDGVDPLTDDYTWLYVLFIILGVSVVPVVLLTRKRK